MGLVLEEFYQNIVTASVSAVTGEVKKKYSATAAWYSVLRERLRYQGIENLFAKIREAAEEYHTTYRPMMEAKYCPTYLLRPSFLTSYTLASYLPPTPYHPTARPP
eukprot:2252573-Rhodomonas_salina.1